MTILPLPQQIASAHAVLNGPHGAVSQLARQCRRSRQALYRQAEAVTAALDPQAQRPRYPRLRQRLGRAYQQLRELRRRQRHLVAVSPDHLARFAATAQAEGVSLPVGHRLLAVLMPERAPSVARLGRYSRRAAQRAGALLEVLDAASGPLVRQAAADEIFVGRRPILMVVEPNSLCWQSGRRAERRDGAHWAAELARLPNLEQLTCDAALGLANGARRVNAAREQAGQEPLVKQDDHFHVLREGPRVLRQLQGRVSRLMQQAEAAEAAAARLDRQGRNPSGPAGVAGRRWRQAEAAMDRWAADERTWQQVRQALALWTPAGELNTRERATAALAVLVPQLAGPEWAKVRRLLSRPQLLTFLDRAQEGLAAVAAPDGVRELLVRAEGLRHRPEALQGAGPAAAARRGVVLAAAALVAAGGAEVAAVAAAVGRVVRDCWRSSSLVEGLNSVLRMQQGRHRRLTQELLDLKRLYWNCRPLGRRRQRQAPYALLGLRLPAGSWWDLLQLPPEQLRQQLSAADQAA